MDSGGVVGLRAANMAVLLYMHENRDQGTVTVTVLIPRRDCCFLTGNAIVFGGRSK